MKTNKKEKFTFEKFEIARLQKNKIHGGNDGDPKTTTRTSKDCSTRPGCTNDPDPSIDDPAKVPQFSDFC